jgi:hypothetical protein
MVTATILGGVVRVVNAMADANRRKAEGAIAHSERYGPVSPANADCPFHSSPASGSTR